MPRTVCIDHIVFVSPGHNATYSVLAPSMGKPAVEPLVSNEATVMANVPEGTVFGYVVGVR